MYQHLQPGFPLAAALSQTVGRNAAESMLELGEKPTSDGSSEKRFLMPAGGVPRVWLTASGVIGRSEIVDGQAVWDYRQRRRRHPTGTTASGTPALPHYYFLAINAQA